MGCVWHRGDSEVLCCCFVWGFRCFEELEILFSSACGRVGSVYVMSYCDHRLISELKHCIRELSEGWVIWDTGGRQLLVCSSSV